ncbi:putative inner membrane protein [uncultured Helicobacter sp.]|uniref:Putative inner membrane protein n=2 Tax=Helicobacter fennelliae TaxID=215 RepID=T1CPN1_9HELI|nr:putative inner membrane protein [uncultured Helicobacter sp.]GAD18714.1 putative inner membrane protein [Helicobacter fennelliae MRY12-0050]
MPLAIVMSMRRVGEYALVKPGREMLFVPLGADEKYKVKSFLDSVLYRAGDAFQHKLRAYWQV